MLDAAARIAEVVGTENVVTDPAELVVYEADGITHGRTPPAMAVLPASTDEVVRVVAIAREARMPIVPRGAGTGLSGGARPTEGSIVLSLSRMRRILEVDLANGWIRVEPGVINLDVTRAVAGAGMYYAPDPSSQGVCSIGGNVAENSGGAHCLKYGFTTNHVLAAKVVLSDGSVVDLGGPAPDAPGYDLLAALVGSEGLVGIVTEVTLRLLRKPETTRTFFATFPTTDEGGAAVSGIIAAGILPAAIEMMDRLAIVAAKAATGLDWPDVGAALLMDADGTKAEVEHVSARAIEIARAAGALEIRVPRDEAERQLMWKGRKSAFAAVGRISPSYMVEDGVIPRSEIARVLREIERMAREAGLRVANVFHAGDGNLHPLVLYDARNPGEEERAAALGGEILRLCIRSGGSITGEHGVGAEKARYMAEQFTAADLETMARVRCAFDGLALMNPGKVFPTPRLCGEKPGPYQPHPLERAGLAERW
ncbi:MAG TPA: FAD-linked oxidase C-terminal domain-containing protein [Anaeromyxobacter sp.]